MVEVDIALVKNENGIYDIAIDDDGDFKTTNGFDTSILITIFGKRRADESEVPIGRFREGWVGNEFNGFDDFQNGSKAWLLKQSRRTQDNVNLLQTYLQEGFDWMVDDDHLDNVEVVTSISANGFVAEIDFIRDGSSTKSRSFQLWDNTGDDL